MSNERFWKMWEGFIENPEDYINNVIKMEKLLTDRLDNYNNWAKKEIENYWVEVNEGLLSTLEEETTVVNKYKEEYDVYIGRGSKWGNPYVEGRDGNRTEVIAKYREYLWDKVLCGEITISELLELDGMKLGCFCKPKKCHGDVLVEAVEWAKRGFNEEALL